MPVSRARRLVLAVFAASLFVNLGHPASIKEDAGFIFAAETLFGDKRDKHSTFVMGGVVFEYTEQDWSGNEAALADALTETYLASIYPPSPAMRAELIKGYSKLLGHCSPAASHMHCHQLGDLGLSPRLLA